MFTETLLWILYSVQFNFKLTGASCKHFQCQNRLIRVFEAGYWKDFLNLVPK